MSTLRNLKRFQHARAKRGSLEEKTKIFEENARKAKLSIDKELLVQVLQEENRAHDDTIKELNEQLQEENRMHDDTIKELEEKIADLEMQIKSSSEAESISVQMPSESAQEITESAQEITESAQEITGSPKESSTEVDEQAEADPYHDVRALLKDSEVAPEAPKKKKRGLFVRG